METKIDSGFKQWSQHTVNCCTGCSNNCRYCYARGMAARFRKISPQEWPVEKVRRKDVERSYRRYPEIVMFPSSHDITPGNMDACLIVLGKLLDAGTRVLLVSKPRPEIIARICEVHHPRLDQILFRLTIGAMDDRVLEFWEPGAPMYKDRLESLKLSHCAGFATSVSIEPMLAPENIVPLIQDLEPFVTETIWIGKMNHTRKDIVIDSETIAQAVHRIEIGQGDEAIMRIFGLYREHPLIRWKTSILKVVAFHSSIS